MLPLLRRRPHHILRIAAKARHLPGNVIDRILVIADIRKERVREFLFRGGARQAGLSLLRRPPLRGGRGGGLDGELDLEDAQRAVAGVGHQVLAVAADDDLTHQLAA